MPGQLAHDADDRVRHAVDEDRGVQVEGADSQPARGGRAEDGDALLAVLMERVVRTAGDHGGAHRGQGLRVGRVEAESRAVGGQAGCAGHGGVTQGQGPEHAAGHHAVDPADPGGRVRREAHLAADRVGADVLDDHLGRREFGEAAVDLAAGRRGQSEHHHHRADAEHRADHRQGRPAGALQETGEGLVQQIPDRQP
jgi:hypothetical protein